MNRFYWKPPADQQFGVATLASVVALSPDGRRIVYAAEDGLHVRSMGELDDHLIPGTGVEPAAPISSPDGQSVAYFTRDGDLRRVAIGGGAPVVVADGVSNLVADASWGPDGTILFGQAQGIFRVPASGGQPRLVVPAKAGEQFYGAQLLPDGDSMLFSVTTDPGNWSKAQVVVQSLASGKRTVLIKAGSDPRYVPTGHLVYAVGDQLSAVAFDVDTLSVSGSAVPIAQGVMRALFGATGAVNYGVSSNGTLAYVSGNAAPLGFRDTPVWVDREGHEEPLGLEPCICSNPAASPDGKRVAVEVLEPNGTAGHIWIWSPAQRTLTRLTFEPGVQTGPLWTPDSTQLAYVSIGEGIFVRNADGTGVRKQLFRGPAVPWAWTPKGELIFSDSIVSSQHFGLLPVAGAGEPKFVLPAEFNEWSAALSPDGRWLAYQSDGTGAYEIYVRPFPDVDGGGWQISSGGGVEPKWARDGHTLFLVSPNSLMATTIETTPAFSFRAPEAVIDRAGYVLGHEEQGPPGT